MIACVRLCFSYSILNAISSYSKFVISMEIRIVVRDVVMKLLVTTESAM